MPFDLVVDIIEDFIDFAVDRIIGDINDIRDTLSSVFDFMLDLLGADDIFDSNVELSYLLSTKQTCATNPTVDCYLTSIFNQLTVNPLVLNFIPGGMRNFLLSPEIVSGLWSNVNSGGIRFGDCLQSFFKSICKGFLSGRTLF